MFDFIYDLSDEFESLKKRYIPLFKLTVPPMSALYAWLATATLMLSLAVDGNTAPPLDSTVSICLSATLAFELAVSLSFAIRHWDLLNAVLFATECFGSWLGFRLAALLPFERSSLGRLFYITVLGIVAAFLISYFVDKKAKDIFAKRRH